MKKLLPAFALLVDIVLVIAFAAAGRRSHAEESGLVGLLTTAWPFLAGLGIGWLATVGLYREKFDATLAVPTGILVWISTLVVGMALRVAAGQGTAFSFILVAASFLALFLIGWRAVYRALRARRITH